MNTNSNQAIASLLNAGADAMSNMYEVIIAFPTGSSEAGGTEQTLTVRAEGFDIPEMEVGSYDLEYHGQKISKPKPQLNFDRKFSITFRMDAEYELHKLFLKWQGMVGNPVTGGVANFAPALGTVTVRALKDNYIAAEDPNYSFIDKLEDSKPYGGAIKSGAGLDWCFKQVWVAKVGQPKFKTEGGDKMTFAVDFKFGQCSMPGYNADTTTSAN